MILPSSTSEKILCCLSYLSILFLPVVFPLIVWIVAMNHGDAVTYHAKRAFWSQIFPALYILVALIIYFIAGATGMSAIRNAGGWLFGILLVLALLISLLLYIYNLAMAVRVLLDR
ncbi:DUF4870 domain-containing protein [Limosilactobacillus secaliphilus]|uniref:DUF4870 domain-containing protein n=1 Tax=Limosilactobacillus secaliphilus TaxID=396268 RepID=UPI00070C9FE0